MYLGVAGACAEQKANASVAAYTLEGISFQETGDFIGQYTVELGIGTGKLVIIDLSGDTVEAYDFDDATIPAVDLSSNESDNPSLNSPRGFTFGDNGNYYYVAGIATPWIRRLTLSTAYDVSTASAPSAQDISSSLHSAGAQGIAFNDNGTKLFIADQGFVKTVTLTTAWDLSAGSTSTHTINTTDDDGDAIANISCIRFNADGTKMFLSYRTSFGDEAQTANHPKIAEFDLSTAYTVSTKTFVRHLDVHPNLGLFDTTPVSRPTFIGGFDWNSDGTELFMSAVHQDASDGVGPKILRYAFS